VFPRVQEGRASATQRSATGAKGGRKGRAGVGHRSADTASVPSVSGVERQRGTEAKQRPAVPAQPCLKVGGAAAVTFAGLP
jgi:hypothetical protein